MKTKEKQTLLSTLLIFIGILTILGGVAGIFNALAKADDLYFNFAHIFESESLFKLIFVSPFVGIIVTGIMFIAFSRIVYFLHNINMKLWHIDMIASKNNDKADELNTNTEVNPKILYYLKEINKKLSEEEAEKKNIS